MSKRPVSWHENCLVNCEASIDRDLENIKRRQDAVSLDIERAALLRAQIEEAKRRGMTAFDSDRLPVKRKKEAGK